MKYALLLLALLFAPLSSVSAQNSDPNRPAKNAAKGLAYEMRGERFDRFENAKFLDDIELDSVVRDYGRARAYTDCVARSGEKRLRELLESNPGSDEESKAARYVMSRFKYCSGNVGSISLRLLRGAAAESLLSDKLESGGKELAPIAYEDLAALTPDQESGDQDAFTALQTLAECEVSQSIPAAMANLEKPVEISVQESEQSELASATPACGSGIGSNPVLALLHRTFLAEALYHSMP